MTAPAVFVTRRLPGPVMERLARSAQVSVWEEDSPIPRRRLLDDAPGKRALITLLTERVDDELLDAAGPDLVIVANYAVGFDNIDVPACTRRGVLVSNTPDVLTETTADLTWALMLAAARRVAEGDRFLRTGQGWTWGPQMLLGQDVYGKVLGIVGYGRIGRAVARRAAGFGMRVLYHDPAVSAADAGSGVEPAGLDDLLATADFVALHVNLTAETRHLINAERLSRMKSTAVLVNAARGPIIDEAALAEALERGHLFAAGLDVFEREPEVHPRLRDSPRAVLVPHLGSATVETRDAMGMLAVENVLAALDGRRPPTLLNPEAWKAG